MLTDNRNSPSHATRGSHPAFLFDFLDGPQQSIGTLGFQSGCEFFYFLIARVVGNVDVERHTLATKHPSLSEGSRGKLFRLSGAFRLARKRQWKERQQG